MLKRVLIIVGVSIVVLLLTAITLAAFFEKEIGHKIIESVNDQLETEIQVSDFELSLFSGFPDVSAKLQEVLVLDRSKAPILEAEQVSFRFGLAGLFRAKKEIHTVLIQNGALSISIDKKGNANYNILKSSQSTDSNVKPVLISLKEAILRNMELIYSNEQTNQAMAFDLENALFSGQFSTKEFSLKSMAKLESHFIELGDLRYLVGKEVGYVADIFVNLNSGFYDFQKLDVAIDRNVFKVDGYIDSKKEGSEIDLNVTSKDGNIESVIQLLPEDYLSSLYDFRGRGKFLFDASIKGEMTARKNPDIQVAFSLENGKISSPRLKNDLKDVSFDARFSNGKWRNNTTSSFEINNFKGYFNRELTEIKFKVQNLSNPKIDFQFDGAIPLAAVYGMLENPNITKASGEIECKQIKIAGLYKDMLNPEAISKVRTSGSLEFDDATLYFNKEKLIVDRGSLKFNNNSISLKELKVEGVGSEFSLKGKCSNLLPVLFADSLNSKNAQLKFNAELTAETLDLDRLVGLSTTNESEKQSIKSVKDSLEIAQTQKREHFANFLQGSFKANVANFNYNKIEGERFVGDLKMRNNILIVSGEADAMEGYFELDGKIFFEKDTRVSAKIKSTEINLKDFFLQTENLGQEVLVADNVSGTLTARILLEAFWNEKGIFEDRKLHVLSAVSIEDGELVNFKMLEDFSNIIHLKDLQHIKFTDTENWLQIKNNAIFIPTMLIRSNALNLTVSGVHTFDQDIDYNVKLNAAQVLVNYLKPHNPNLTPQKSDKKGFFNLYYNLHGPIDDFKVKMNRTKVKNAIHKSLYQQQIIQNKLKAEFGDFQLLDEPQEWLDEGEKKPIISIPALAPKDDVEKTSTDEDDGFIDWDDK